VAHHHSKHNPVAKHASLAEHTPHRYAPEWSELLAQELGKAVAGNHPQSSTAGRSDTIAFSPASSGSPGDPSSQESVGRSRPHRKADKERYR